ncbi:P protein-like [Patiria miniata]|uniref:Citrate transporter-like domain-containing protein n=1 Tax=Patiria miniata TaxID=46514 RepID=A0A913ZW32_PATMI|nr:P protein-like [Patiria miniata]
MSHNDETDETSHSTVYSSSIPEDDILQTDFNETTQLLTDMKKKHRSIAHDGYNGNGISQNSFTVGYSADLVTPETKVASNNLPVYRRMWSSLSLSSQGDGDTKKSWMAKFKTKKAKHILNNLKIGLLLMLMLVVLVFFSLQEETEAIRTILPTSRTQSHVLNISDINEARLDVIRLGIAGAFVIDSDEAENPHNATVILARSSDGHVVKEYNFILDTDEDVVQSNQMVETIEKILLPWDDSHEDDTFYIKVSTDTEHHTVIAIRYLAMPYAAQYDVIYAGVILIAVYVLIGFDLVHRTVAAMLGSFAVLATLAALNERPPLETIMTWIDYETLSLLWGMMTLVAIFSETGFFDYCALKAYKMAKGKVWTLIIILCVFSGAISSVLDNVTTVLLLTPVTIRLCEVLELDPKYILIAEVMFSNIGGTATAIGDPPNVIIVSNKGIQEAGIDFAEFTLHMFIGIIFCMLAGFLLLWLQYRKMNLSAKDPPEIRELKREIELWRQAATRIMVATKEEATVKKLLMQKVYQLEDSLKHQMVMVGELESSSTWRENLKELQKKYRITDKNLLIKCSIVLIAAILTFFIQSIDSVHLNLGWTALLAATFLLVLADINDIENVMHRIEWATLVFFAALFVLMEGLTHLGLIDFIGSLVSALIKAVPKDGQLTVAIILLVWVSAIASSFIDNIPFTTAMVPIILSLGNDPNLDLPLKPLVWSLAFGACLGGNGTLIGASANVVCAGIAEQHGCSYNFREFMRVGFPMMLVTTFVAMCYLLIAHSWAGWNY